MNSWTIGIGIKMSQSNIQPNGSIGRLSLLNSFLVNAKLNVVPVDLTHNSNSFNLLQLIKVQVTGSPQLKDSCCKTIGEGDTFPVFRQLIFCRFVLNRTVSLMFFEAWETFLSWFAFFTVVVESRNRRPRSLSRSLSSLRIEFASEPGILSPRQHSMHSTRTCQCLCCPSST
jgi:hypothetical protein